jgi:hypothetical protein
MLDLKVQQGLDGAPQVIEGTTVATTGAVRVISTATCQSGEVGGEVGWLLLSKILLHTPNFSILPSSLPLSDKRSNKDHDSHPGFPHP